jgi:hypothetical protein
MGIFTEFFFFFLIISARDFPFVGLAPVTLTLAHHSHNTKKKMTSPC